MVKENAMTRRGVAPVLMAGVHRHGGSKDKAQAGLAINELTPDWAVVRCYWTTCNTPGNRTVGCSFRKPQSGGSNPPRGADSKWALECLNTPEPASVTRMRGTDCTGKGNLSISFVRAFSQEARNERLTAG